MDPMMLGLRKSRAVRAHLGLSSLLQLGEDHGRDLSRGELPLLAEVVDLDGGGSVLVDDLKGAA